MRLHLRDTLCCPDKPRVSLFPISLWQRVGGIEDTTMGRALLEAERPRMWQIDQGPNGPGSETVRLGARHIRLVDIETVAFQEIQDRNTQGLILGGMAFAVFATIFAYLVFDAGWRSRFLLGMGFMSFLSCIGLAETLTLKRLSLYQLFIGLKSGELVTFTSSDRADTEALALRLMAGRAQAV